MFPELTIGAVENIKITQDKIACEDGPAYFVKILVTDSKNEVVRITLFNSKKQIEVEHDASSRSKDI